MREITLIYTEHRDGWIDQDGQKWRLDTAASKSETPAAVAGAAHGSALVESGAKRQTVRPTPNRMPKPGERISLRMWTGKPYRSKQRVLREAIISEVGMVDITETGIAVNGYAEPCDDFAVADGFRDFFELRDWFKATHGLPFEGVVIKWHNAEVSDGGHK